MAPLCFYVHFLAVAVNQLQSAGRASFYIAPPMVEVAVQSTAVSASITRVNPAFLTAPNSAVLLSTAENIVGNAAFGLMHIPSADLAKTYFASDLSALIFAVNNPQTGTAVPGHVDRAEIVDVIHGSLAARFQILVIGILHMHQLNPCAFGVQSTKGIQLSP